MVTNKTREKVQKAISDTSLNVSVITEDEFDEKILQFCGQGRAQGRKLYTSTDTSEPLASQETENKDEYGTLGCLANLNNQMTVALTSMHVGYNTVYIENRDNVRIPLGTGINQLPEQEYIQIQNDLAIIAVDRRAEEYLCEKKLLNYDETPTNAVICKEQLPKLYREIIHKFGASSKWTQGEIVLSELVSENQGIIGVRGMNNQVFGTPGDSGSIVFRETFVNNQRELEVVAVLSGRYEQNTVNKSTEDTEPEQSCSLITCKSFHKALMYFQQQHDLETPIESIDFFNH